MVGSYLPAGSQSRPGVWTRASHLIRLIGFHLLITFTWWSPVHGQQQSFDYANGRSVAATEGAPHPRRVHELAVHGLR